MKYSSDRYDKGGMIIVTILMLIGFILIFVALEDFKSGNNYISDNSIIIVFSLFFVGVGIYVWYLYINNVIIKPRKEVLYLSLIDKTDGFFTFLDKKGKVYLYTDNNSKSYKPNSYYECLKTKNNIKKVLKECLDIPFEVPVKQESYFLNLYLPFGNFENIFLLPIIYVILVIGIIYMVFAPFLEKTIGIFIVFSAGGLILYDYLYKRKKKILENENKLDSYLSSDINEHEELENIQRKAIDIYAILRSVISVLASVAICGILLIWFFVGDIVFKFALIPFLGVGILALAKSIISLILVINFTNKSISSEELERKDRLNKKLEKMSKLFSKLSIISFLIYWFGILIVGCYISIVDGSLQMVFFTIPFWIVGILLLVKGIKG